MKTKRRKERKNVTSEKGNMGSANKNARGYKFAPLFVANCCGLSSPYWSFRSRSDILLLHAVVCRSSTLAFFGAINFTIKRSALCSAVLRHSPSPWAAVVHRPALVPKALRSPSRRHHILSFSCPPTQLGAARRHGTRAGST